MSVQLGMEMGENDGGDDIREKCIWKLEKQILVQD
jgi:hypothetical protein